MSHTMIPTSLQWNTITTNMAKPLFFFLRFVEKCFMTRKRPSNRSITARIHGQASDQRDRSTLQQEKRERRTPEELVDVWEAWGGSESKSPSLKQRKMNTDEVWHASDTHYLKYFSTFVGLLSGSWKQINVFILHLELLLHSEGAFHVHAPDKRASAVRQPFSFDILF